MGQTGKIQRKLLEDVVIEKTGFQNPNVLQGPKFGVDTALIKIGESLGMVTASDPTSLIPSLGMKDSAWLSVTLTANDVATSGVLPKYAQFVFNFPMELNKKDFEEYWYHIHLFCKEMGITITGGHTGFSNTGPSTISGAVTMFSEIDLPMAKSTAFIQPNQDLILTKSAALSSSAILARSFPKHTAQHLGQASQLKLAESFYQLSILPEIKTLNAQKELFSQVSGIHDCTEGGVLGAIYELSQASETGAKIYKDKIPLGKEQALICQLFGIDPLRSIAAGSMLLACKPEATQNILSLLRDSGVKANKVGLTLEKPDLKIVTPSGEEAMVYQEEDPYWHAFFNAIEQKLD